MEPSRLLFLLAAALWLASWCSWSRDTLGLSCLSEVPLSFSGQYLEHGQTAEKRIHTAIDRLALTCSEKVPCLLDEMGRDTIRIFTPYTHAMTFDPGI